MDWIKSTITKPKKKDPPLSSHPSDILLRNGVTEDFAKERLTSADLASYVAMPTGLDPNEWLASHTVSFFEHINLLYGCLVDFCQTRCCQSTSATYQWVDEKGKKLKCQAPQYIDYIMSYVQKCVEDETIFPTKYGNKFPSNFESTVRKIHCRLQTVVSHVYSFHLKDVMNLQLQAYLNTVFYHFYLFNQQFHLIDDKEASDVLDGLFALLQKTAKEAATAGAALTLFSSTPSAATNAPPNSNRSLTPPPLSTSKMFSLPPQPMSLSQPRHRGSQSPAAKIVLSQSRIRSPFKSKESVSRDSKSSPPFRPLSIAT